MCSIVDYEFVVTVNFQVIETDHESFQYRFGLESDDTIDISLIVGHHNSAIYWLWYI
jgi:hypothetical protein